MEYIYDFFTHGIPNFTHCLTRFKDKPVNFLEIGSLEGRSAIWMLENILTHEDAKITCVDNGSVVSIDVLKNNLKEFNRKVILINADSAYALSALLIDRQSFDFIYVDAYHDQYLPLRDMVYAYELLKVGGIMGIDDCVDQVTEQHGTFNVRTCFNSFISAKAYSLGLKANKSITNRRHLLNQEYFSIPNIENSYWAGFIAADGNIRQGLNQLSLYQSDEDVIKKFIDCLQYAGKISYRKRQNSIEYSVNITSKIIINNLYNIWNIHPKKSFYGLIPPSDKIDKKLALSYICGLIDGDGYISDRGSHLRFGVLGSKNLLIWINNITNSDIKIYKRIDCKAELYVMQTSHKKAVCFLNTIYVPEIKDLIQTKKWNNYYKYANKYYHSDQ